MSKSLYTCECDSIELKSHKSMGTSEEWEKLRDTISIQDRDVMWIVNKTCPNWDRKRFAAIKGKNSENLMVIVEIEEI